MQASNRTDLDSVLGALSELDIEYEWVGPARRIDRVCSLARKESHGLYYFVGDDPSVFEGLDESVVICTSEAATEIGNNSALIVEGDVQVVFYRLCGALFRESSEARIHPTAIIDPEARLGEEVQVGPYAVIGRCRIGVGSRIDAHVVVRDGCEIGDRAVIEPGCRIGMAGVQWAWDEQGDRAVMPFLGGVTIEDDCFLGSDVVIVRGVLNESTFVGRGSMLAPGTKLGHGTWIGELCHLANNVSIAGSVRIGERSFLGSGCSVRPHVQLATRTVVGVGAAVISDVTTPGCIVAGVPAKEVPRAKNPKGVPRLT